MTLSRRSVIKRAGAAGSLLLADGLPLWAKAEQPAGEPAPADYVRLSAALLGVEAARLEPAVRGGEAPLADTFHGLCREAAPAACDALLAAYRAAADGGAGPAVAELLLSEGGRPRPDAVGALARLTMLMWLYGVWYGGTETTRMPDGAEAVDPDHRTDFVVSVRAYRNGWIWRFAQARAMGVAGAPGAWAEAPPSFDEVLEGTREFAP